MDYVISIDSNLLNIDPFSFLSGGNLSAEISLMLMGDHCRSEHDAM